MKGKLVVTGIAFAILAFVVGLVWWRIQLSPVSPNSELVVSFVIPRGQPAAVVLTDLQDEGIIKSSLAGRIYLTAMGLGQKIQNGTFELSPGMTVKEVLEVLSQPPRDIWITIPEGFRREQTAARFDTQLQGAEKLFDAQEFLGLTVNLEGQLFPDTYLVPRYASAQDVVDLLTTNFFAKSPLDPISQRDELILASLVEREGKTDSDRPVIAGILKNRLEAGWPLQVDATVQYGRDTVVCGKMVDCEWWAPLSDTKYVSSFNTYLRSGLPPAPISSPGLAAITAVLNSPETPYWYYLHSPDGQVYYGQTLEEHNANIDKYLRY